MRNIDRRQWLKSIGLAGTAALLAKTEAFALDIEPRPFLDGEPIKLNFNESIDMYVCMYECIYI